MTDTTTIAELDILIAACEAQRTSNDQDRIINMLLDRMPAGIINEEPALYYLYAATAADLRALRMRMCSAPPSWRPAVGEAVSHATEMTRLRSGPWLIGKLHDSIVRVDGEQGWWKQTYQGWVASCSISCAHGPHATREAARDAIIAVLGYPVNMPEGSEA